MAGLARVVPLSLPGGKARVTSVPATAAKVSANITSFSSSQGISPFTMAAMGPKFIASSVKKDWR